jgi:hypothetical protein
MNLARHNLRRAIIDARAHARGLGHDMTRFGRADTYVGALYTTATCRTCGGAVTARATDTGTYCYGSAADASCAARQAHLAALGRTFDGTEFPRVGTTSPALIAPHAEPSPSPWGIAL